MSLILENGTKNMKKDFFLENFKTDNSQILILEIKD